MIAIFLIFHLLWYILRWAEALCLSSLCNLAMFCLRMTCQWNKYAFIWWLVMTNWVCAFTQPDPGIFKHITNGPAGFFQTVVKDILEDRDGFIWVATTQGLFRYGGGGDFRIFRENPLDSTGIGDSFINALAEDDQGFLWLGSAQAGLFKYDRYRDKFTRFGHNPNIKNSPPSNRISHLLVDQKNRLWMASYSGLSCLDLQTGHFTHYQHKEDDPTSISGNKIISLREDLKGRIWAGTERSGLNCVDPETGKVFRFLVDPTKNKNSTNDRIIEIGIGDKGMIWFSTENNRLNRIDPVSFEITSYAIFPTANIEEAYNINEILADKNGNLWLGTIRKGLVHFSPKSGKVVLYQYDPKSNSSIPSNYITKLLTDDNGILWLGHGGSGISQMMIHSTGFEILPIHFEGYENHFAPGFRCVLEDHLGNIWIGTTASGLYRFDPRTGKTSVFRNQPTNPNSLANNMIWDLVEDSEGLIWIGTHNGLQSFDPIRESFQTYGKASGLESKFIRSLWVDHTGKLWIGTFGGLHWFDSQNGKIIFEDFQLENPDFIIHELFEDRDHNLWVSAFGHGVYRLNLLTGDLAFFQHQNNDFQSLSNNNVLSIVEDAKKRIWLATKGGGINLFLPHATHPDSSQFRHWRPYNSAIPDEIIHDISVDKYNRLWLSTDLGLYLFNPETENIKSYTLPGPIKGLLAETGPSVNPEGNLYVGNIKHIYRFHPDSIWQNKSGPPVFITDLEIGNKRVPIRHSMGDSLQHPSPLNQSILYTSSLNLDHWQNDLTFVFSALNFIQPENNRYKFKLESYDEHWVERDASRRYARYTNLPPGEYTFRVIAANNEGIWNNEGKSILLHISPPWWRTWWAYCAYLLIFGSILWGIRRYELNRHLIRAEAHRLKELDAVKTKLYTNITHEFRTPLTVILGMVDHLKSQLDKQKSESLELINRNGKQLLNLVNQMLDLAKMESGHLKLEQEQGDIINYLRYLLESFHSYAESKRIRLHFLSELKEFHMDYDPNRLMYVMSNLLSNAIKFSPEDQDVYVSAHSQNSKFPKASEVFIIRVKDTGIGIPEDKLPFIFDRFYQVDDSMTRKGEGTGIGLTLTRELVKLMNGEIMVNSEPGKGSEFTVKLPVSRKQVLKSTQLETNLVPAEFIPSEAHVSSKKETGKALMLIVEDNPDLVKYLLKFFNPIYKLEVAYNGQQGIKKALTLIPDIILTDVMMPEKDGFELCDILKNHELTSHIPIIMLTAKANVESRMKGLKKGADAYLAKPFLQKELNTRVEALLLQRKRLQAYYLKRVGSKQQVPKEDFQNELEHQHENQFLKKVNAHIFENLDNHEFGVERLSEELFVSSSNLYRKLKALTGLSSNQYIRLVRLNKARELLQNSSLSIATVAYETGFTDPHYFSRMFKKEFGMTPTKYRVLK